MAPDIAAAQSMCQGCGIYTCGAKASNITCLWVAVKSQSTHAIAFSPKERQPHAHAHICSPRPTARRFWHLQRISTRPTPLARAQACANNPTDIFVFTGRCYLCRCYRLVVFAQPAALADLARLIRQGSHLPDSARRFCSV